MHPGNLRTPPIGECVRRRRHSEPDASHPRPCGQAVRGFRGKRARSAPLSVRPPGVRAYLPLHCGAPAGARGENPAPSPGVTVAAILVVTGLYFIQAVFAQRATARPVVIEGAMGVASIRGSFGKNIS